MNGTPHLTLSFRPFIQKPGDIVGYLGIDLVAGTNTSVTDTRLQTITLTGYPYDFDEQMVTSGVCSDSRTYKKLHF
jgi:hypothetical protein